MHLFDVHGVYALANDLGIDISQEEAIAFKVHLEKHMAKVDAFMQQRIREHRPPVTGGERSGGYRPDSAEDPLNAWLWKCTVPGAANGLLAGKTVSFKDNIAVAGMPMTFGSSVLDTFVVDFDATVVTRVLAAGGTVVGKNTMNGPSGGFGTGGSVGDYPRPLNPHAHDHVTGASSSGSAAAVAGGEVDIAFGGDQGGSIRAPAAYCGIIGVKPTFGLVSHFGLSFGADQSLDYTGPMTRTAADAARALQATAGYDEYDPRQRRGIPDSIDVLSGLDDGVRGLRIGVLDEGFEHATPQVRERVLSAIKALQGSGAEVSHVRVPEHHTIGMADAAIRREGSLGIFRTGLYGMFSRTYYPPAAIAEMNKLYEYESARLAPRTKLTLMVAEQSRRSYHGRAYAKAQNVRPTYIKAYDDVLATVDVLVMPTVPRTAPENHVLPTAAEALEDNLGISGGMVDHNTFPFNYTGHPAIAVPVGFSDGLPVSMQIVGRFFEDGLLLRTAHALQQLIDT